MELQPKAEKGGITTSIGLSAARRHCRQRSRKRPRSRGCRCRSRGSRELAVKSVASANEMRDAMSQRSEARMSKRLANCDAMSRTAVARPLSMSDETSISRTAVARPLGMSVETSMSVSVRTESESCPKTAELSEQWGAPNAMSEQGGAQRNESKRGRPTHENEQTTGMSQVDHTRIRGKSQANQEVRAKSNIKQHQMTSTAAVSASVPASVVPGCDSSSVVSVKVPASVVPIFSNNAAVFASVSASVNPGCDSSNIQKQTRDKQEANTRQTKSKQKADIRLTKAADQTTHGLPTPHHLHIIFSSSTSGMARARDELTTRRSPHARHSTHHLHHLHHLRHIRAYILSRGANVLCLSRDSPLVGCSPSSRLGAGYLFYNLLIEGNGRDMVSE
eukprot:CAMPEP_0119343736 /NCGR_PEP_ID=MMETSP1333-20130426/106607_1 /TAXON_ID=418940 /ORGANISM="Scyphosphaera apsteinii, Strain RCC1455" /LENGTH=390 /DNA_ID=CAMNT_0007356147 /DNA_START=536 /DNA_END=1708 /DNA_ORIENTATION=+